MRAIAVCLLLASTTAAAEPTSGVDSALFRGAYDANGVFSVEGARLLPKHDLSLRAMVGYARSPIDLAVPGIGGAGDDHVLDYIVTLDLAFGISLTDHLALGIDVGAYRTATGDGYGVRGRYGSGGLLAAPSTGLIALRPLSNIDPSADPDDSAAYLGDDIAGPLDARVGLKYMMRESEHTAITAIGSVALPFGEDEMLLGDRNLVFEPMLAMDWRKDRRSATRLVANVGARIRERSVLQSYDAGGTETPADAKVVLDVGSELTLGFGGVLELAPRFSLGAEAQLLLPLPDSVTYGSCKLYDGRRCSSLSDRDYTSSANHGDLTVLATAGAMVRVTADLTAQLMVGTGQIGARGDDYRVTAGLIWAPQLVGASAPGRNDRDGDGVPDSVDLCPDDPEDRDGYQDDDGCPDLDNDGDGIPDRDDQCPNEPEDKDGFKDEDGCRDNDNDEDGIPDPVDRCPDQAEDIDGFEDDDGCPDPDNDGDGFLDADDKCPNDAETVNGVDDDDGCPDVRNTAGPEERADRIDLKGAPIAFTRASQLSPAARTTLAQTAALIKAQKLSIRVEVRVAKSRAGTRADTLLATRRAKAIVAYLVAQGVPAGQLQASGIGPDRAERVDLLKQGDK